MKLDLASASVQTRLFSGSGTDAASRHDEARAQAFARLTERPTAELKTESAQQAKENNAGLPSRSEEGSGEGQGDPIAALAAALENGTALNPVPADADDAEALAAAVENHSLIEKRANERTVEKPQVLLDEMPGRREGMINSASSGMEIPGRANAKGAGVEGAPARGGQLETGMTLPANARGTPYTIGAGPAVPTRSDSEGPAQTGGSARQDRTPEAKQQIKTAGLAEQIQTANPAMLTAFAAPAAGGQIDAAGLAASSAASAVVRGEVVPAARFMRSELPAAVTPPRMEGSSKSIFGTDGAALQARIVQGQNGITNVPVGNFWQVVTTASGPSIVNSLSTLAGAPAIHEPQQAPQFAMQIQLHPKSLGEVSVHILRVGTTVHVDIRTQTAQAERLLKSDGNNLLDAFKAADGKIEEVNLRVTTSQESANAALRNSRDGERDAWFGRSGFEGSDAGKSGQGGSEHREGEFGEARYLQEGPGDGELDAGAHERRRSGTYL